MITKTSRFIVIWALVYPCLAVSAQAQENMSVLNVRYGYFTETRPTHAACARGFFDLRLPSKDILYRVTCYPQESGGYAASRMDNGDLDIANLGSTPLAQAIARRISLKTIYISHYMGESQAILTRPSDPKEGYQGIQTPFDLAGRTIGVPFGSTMHYQTLFLLDLFGLIGSVTLLDLSPSQIMTSWDQHLIDAAACWGEAKDHITKHSGKTLLTARDLANWGRPTFVAVAARWQLAEEHPEFVTHFVAVMSRLNDSFLDKLGQQDPQNALRWDAQQPAGTSLVPSMVDALMLGTETPKNPKQETIHKQRRELDSFHQISSQLQMSCEYLGPSPGACDKPTLVEETLKDTAEFLLQQKVIASLGPFQDLDSLADIGVLDGNFLSLAHRECSNCYRVGEYPALAGSNSLLAELEQLSAASGKSPFAANDVGRYVYGDSVCAGLKNITGKMPFSGTIGDGANGMPGKSYSDNLNCAWLIQAPDNTDLVQLSVSKLRLWSGDMLRVYSDPLGICEPGAPTNVLEAQLSGFYKDSSLPPFRARACLLVSFESDGNSEKWYGSDSSMGDGFMASYNRVAPTCTGSSDCNGKTCNKSTGLCECGGDAFGADCSWKDHCLGTSHLVLGQGERKVVTSFDSTNFNRPVVYNNDLDCTWDIYIPSGESVQVTVFYNMEETHDLLYLQAGSLSYGEMPTTYAVLTGTPKAIGAEGGLITAKDAKETYYIPSVHNAASLRFTTDARGRYSCPNGICKQGGFSATLEAQTLDPKLINPHSTPCTVPGASGSLCEVNNCVALNQFQHSAQPFSIKPTNMLGRVVSQVEGYPVPATPWSPEEGCAWTVPPTQDNIVAIRFVFNQLLDLEPKYASSRGDKLVVLGQNGDSTKTEFYIEKCKVNEQCSEIWQTGVCERGGCTVQPAVEAKVVPQKSYTIHLITDRNDGGEVFRGIDFDALLVQQCPNQAGQEHCEHPNSNGKCVSGMCICPDGIPCDCPCTGDAPSHLGAKVGLFVGIVVPLFLLGAVGFFIYRRRKIRSSREKKRIIAEKDAELAAFHDTIVGICVAVREYVPQASTKTGTRCRSMSLKLSYNKEPPKIVWCWQETSHVMRRHDPSTVFGDPTKCWIMYDDQSAPTLERAHQSGKAQVHLQKGYMVDLKKMIQTKQATGFERRVQRVVCSKPDAARELDLSEAHFSDGLPDELKGEPQLVLVKEDLVQISKRRDDGFAFGTKMYHADEPAARELVKLALKEASNQADANICADSGWFQEEATSVPTKDQLSALQTKVGDAHALDAPEYWAPIGDPTVAERIALDLGSSEGLAVVDAFKSTLVPPRYKNVKIKRIERIQNLAMWQTYVVKRQTICYRETQGNSDATDDQVQRRAQERVERRWLWHGTNAQVMEKILQQGFNRSFCGKNATMYGKGVYFARDASYSAAPLYATPDANGYQYIMACRVVVGEYCLGIQDALTPDVRDAKSNQLFDSTVNNLSNPSVYVTYHDAQAYPEYLIQFKTVRG